MGPLRVDAEKDDLGRMRSVLNQASHAHNSIADFNDPRAGTSAEFDILIKDIREATKSEVKPSCARG